MVGRKEVEVGCSSAEHCLPELDDLTILENCSDSCDFILKKVPTEFARVLVSEQSRSGEEFWPV